jgi:hypothetical protein
MEFIKKLFRKKPKENTVATRDVIRALFDVSDMSPTRVKDGVILTATAGFLTTLYRVMPSNTQDLDSEVYNESMKGAKNLKEAYYFLKDCKDACLMLKDQYILESDVALKHAAVIMKVKERAMNYPTFRDFMSYVERSGMENYLAPNRSNMTLLSKEIGRMLSISDKRAMQYIKIFIDGIISRIEICEKQIRSGYIKSNNSFYQDSKTDIDPIIKRTGKPVVPELPGGSSAPPGLVNRRVGGSKPKKSSNESIKKRKVVKESYDSSKYCWPEFDPTWFDKKGITTWDEDRQWTKEYLRNIGLIK